MHFKIISINLWQGGNLFDAILDFLKKENADILSLNEVYDGTDKNLEIKYRSYSILPKLLNYPYTAFAPAFINNLPIGNVAQGNAIFSRFPIQNSKTVFFDIPFNPNYKETPGEYEDVPRNMLLTEILIDKTVINCFCVHGVWGKHGNDSERRLKMADTIVNEIKNKKNVILSGDFNMCPNTKSIDKIETHLTYVFKNELKSTFNMKRKTIGGYATAVVDLMFASKNMKVLSHSCPNVDISDHLPLVAEIEV
jgi:endonuclease/exonuclease/phosphatase family metal-dependent hydrolase